MWIGVIVAVVALAALGIITFLALTAPDGWEDEDGFHYGRENGE